MTRQLFDLQQRQKADRANEEKAGTFRNTQVDEINAIRLLAAEIFGDSGTRQSWPGGDRPYRYGGLLEGGPHQPGIFYMGFFIDPPKVAMHTRRRKLIFIGAKHAEFVAQAKLVGMYKAAS